MARVYLGTQTALQRQVALKVLRGSLAGEEFQTRFLHEGRLLARLNHPNIVAIHDIGQVGDRSYMAMEYLDGGTLSDKMKEGLSVAKVIRICTQIAHALHLSHSHSIVHRDLKPSNIMFRDDITPVLTDFGIARKTDAENRLTKTGMVVGTPYYMSPEQISGKDIDGRADLYSLGIMLYELLTGELPYKAEEPLALAMQHMQNPIPVLPDEFSALQPILAKMLAKDKNDRFPSMLGFCEAVKDLVLSDESFAAKLSGETKLFNSDQFSDPRFGSGGLQVPERVTRDLPSQGNRQSGSGQATVVAPDSGQHAATPKRGRLLPIIASVTGVLVVAAVLFWFFNREGDDGLSERERKRADSMVRVIDNQLAKGQIDSPPGDNAVEALKQLQNIAPNYPPVKERADDIALFYEGRANLKMDSGDLAGAMAEVRMGLEIAPDYADLLELKTELGEEVAEQERQARVNSLLASAAEHVANAQFVTPQDSNAYKDFSAVLELDPLNTTAAQGMTRIQQRLVADIEGALERGDLEYADKLRMLADQLFPGSPLVAEAAQKVQAQVDARDRAAQIRQLLTAAEEAEAANQIFAPPGDNAIEKYQSVLRLDEQNITAQSALETIAEKLTEQANAQLTQKQYQQAVELASAGLRATPGNARLQSIQANATALLDDRARQVQQTLQRAENFAQSGQLLTGEENALAEYRRVLELDSNNAAATAGIGRLPDLVAESLEELLEAQRFDRAAALNGAARQTFPGDRRFARWEDEIASAQAANQEAEALARLMANARQLAQANPLNESQIAAAADAIKQLFDAAPNDVDVVTLLGQYTSRIAERANEIGATGDFNRALDLIDIGLQEFPGNPNLQRQQRQLESARTAALQAEAERIAAISGSLAIDASPWGEVVAIRNGDGKAQEISGDTTTPLVISLVEGPYRVTVRGSGNKEETLQVQVRRKQLVNARANFATLDATEYFEKSGW